jgi:Uma2 family endonuclease
MMRTVRKEVMPKVDVVKKVASSEFEDFQPVELGPMSVGDYLSGPPSNEHVELRYGWLLREGTPSTSHHTVSGSIYRALWSYIRERGLGFVVQHLDVILDEPLRLVVQPDLLVVLKDRRHILGDRVRGAPNLTVEILSPHNKKHDRVRKLTWYRQYGVQEYWIVDPFGLVVQVFDLEAEPPSGPRVYGEADVLESRVIAGFRHPVARFFEHAFDYSHETQDFCLTDRPMPSTPDANADGEVRYDTDPA